jgi:HEAT repeat protein
LAPLAEPEGKGDVAGAAAAEAEKLQRTEARVAALIERLDDSRAARRADAAKALGRIGPAAKEAVPALERTLQNDRERVRKAAATALARLGPEGLAALSKALRSGQRDRTCVAHSLAELGNKAVPVLLDVLESEDTRARYWAARALFRGRRRITTESVMPCLIRLRSKGQIERPLEAAEDGAKRQKVTLEHDRQTKQLLDAAFADIGLQIEGVVPRLAELLEDDRPEVARRAALVLGGIAFRAGEMTPDRLRSLAEECPEAAAAVRNNLHPQGAVGPGGVNVGEILLGAVDCEKPHVRVAAVHGLGSASSPDGAVLAALKRALRDDEVQVRRAAAVALVRRGPAAGPALADVFDDDASVRAAARAGLGRMGTQAVALLLEVVEDEDSAGREDAARLLAGIFQRPEAPGTSEAAKAVPVLVEALDDADPGLRRAAAFALVEACRKADAPLAGEAERAVPVLVDVVLDVKESTHFRYEAEEALVALGPHAEAAVPPLIEALGEDKSRCSAARVLGRMGEEGIPAIPALAAQLDIPGREGGEYSQLARAIGQIAPHAKSEAVPVLVRLLQNQQKGARQAACALGRIGAEDPRAVPALIEALETTSTAEAAATALGGIGEQTIPALLEAVRDPASRGTSLPHWAGETLKTMAYDNRELIDSTILPLLRDEDVRCRRTAVVALQMAGLCTGANADPIIAELVRASVTDDNGFVRDYAGRPLRDVRGRTVKPLKALMQDPDARIRAAAIDKFAALVLCDGPEFQRPGPEIAVPCLVRALRDEDAGVRQAAAKVLACGYPEIQAAWPRLRWTARRQRLDIDPQTVVNILGERAHRPESPRPGRR